MGGPGKQKRGDETSRGEATEDRRTEDAKPGDPQSHPKTRRQTKKGGGGGGTNSVLPDLFLLYQGVASLPLFLWKNTNKWVLLNICSSLLLWYFRNRAHARQRPPPAPVRAAFGRHSLCRREAVSRVNSGKMPALWGLCRSRLPPARAARSSGGGVGRCGGGCAPFARASSADRGRRETGARRRLLSACARLLSHG